MKLRTVEQENRVSEWSDLEKYEVLCREAADAMREAKAIYSAVIENARDEEAALDELETELNGIQEQVQAFKSGRIMLTGDEFVVLSDRARYLEIRVSQQSTVAQLSRKKVEPTGVRIRSVHAEYRARLERFVAEDIGEFAKKRRDELESVLR